MKKVSPDILLTWHANEVNDWRIYLENHTDKVELKSLEDEIVNRFVYKYNVRIEPVILDNQRLSMFEKLIAKLNSVLR